MIFTTPGLSYIRANLTEAANTKTTSLIEAHRINSPFIISDPDFKAMFAKDAQYKKNQPLNWKAIAKAFFKYDVNCLLHGAFMANLEDGRVKMPRALSAFIEACNVQEVVSGGVKNNPIDPTGLLRAQNYDKDVYGNVPYQRMEYTAGSITAYFNIDIGLLKSYDLGDEALTLLVALMLFKIRTFLEDGTRLRTACDLKVIKGPETKEPGGFVIPERDVLKATLVSKIQICKEMFADPPVTEINTKTTIKKKEQTAGQDTGESPDADN